MTTLSVAADRTEIGHLNIPHTGRRLLNRMPTEMSRHRHRHRLLRGQPRHDGIGQRGAAIGMDRHPEPVRPTALIHPNAIKSSTACRSHAHTLTVPSQLINSTSVMGVRTSPTQA